MAFHFKPCTLVPIATNDGRFADFAPFVASINDAGVVAFQATLRDGHSGIFIGDGRSTRDVALSASSDCPARVFTSHPDINRAGQLAVYATLKTGEQAVLMVQPDGRVTASEHSDRCGTIGPLGPTLNGRGEVALRSATAAGQARVQVLAAARWQVVAEAGDRLLGFEGLPVVNEAGDVVFRARLAGDGQGIFVHRQGACSTIATTQQGFDALGRFPVIDDAGSVAFVATRAGRPGVFRVTDGRLGCLVDAQAGFESFRGVLVNNAGPVAFYATPAGGQLGLYTGTDATRHRILGIGDRLHGGAVVDFALNPVSVNERGQLALRVALDDGRQWLLRVDPG